MRVLGVDAAPKGWVAVELVDGQFSRAFFKEALLEIVECLPGAVAVAVDIPIGFPRTGRRQADVQARVFVGPRYRSVFLTPLRAILACETHEAALAEAERLGVPGLSTQEYGLRDKIFEAEEVAAQHARVIEVHPEVTFRHLAGAPLRASKKSWNGSWVRHELLRAKGLDIPVELGRAGTANSDDILDAAAAAWSGTRYARRNLSTRTRQGVL